jgi:hypothetical protein
MLSTDCEIKYFDAEITVTEMCTCIYCVLHCLYCVFVSYGLCITHSMEQSPS